MNFEQVMMPSELSFQKIPPAAGRRMTCKEARGAARSQLKGCHIPPGGTGRWPGSEEGHGGMTSWIQDSF